MSAVSGGVGTVPTCLAPGPALIRADGYLPRVRELNKGQGWKLDSAQGSLHLKSAPVGGSSGGSWRPRQDGSACGRVV